MPTAFMSTWSGVFNKAAIVFSNDVKAAGKVSRARGGALKEMLEAPQQTAPMLGCMDILDKTDLSRGNKKQQEVFPKNLKVFKAATGKLDVEVKKYLKSIEAALDGSFLVEKNLMNVPASLKEAHPETYRQLKILKTEIQSILSQAKVFLDGAEKAEKIDKAGDAGEKEKAKLRKDTTISDDEANVKLKAISEDVALSKYLPILTSNFKSAFSKGAAAIQKLKSDPSLDNYNVIMNDAGRDISQQVVNVNKLRRNPKFKNTSLVKKLADPGGMAAEIAAFGDGAKRRLPNLTAQNIVQAHIDEFINLYKRLAAAYKDIISGKLK